MSLKSGVNMFSTIVVLRIEYQFYYAKHFLGMLCEPSSKTFYRNSWKDTLLKYFECNVFDFVHGYWNINAM